MKQVLGIADHVLHKVRNTIAGNNLLEVGDKVIIGLSGGPDSVCLLHVLSRLSREMELLLFAVHVNHGLRGEESDGDQAYVEALCEKIGIPVFVEAYDIQNISRRRKISLEEAGRDARYEYFGRMLEKLKASRIAVAHNWNDQVETVLMNIIRGSGLDGLKGMGYKRGDIIRPLLDLKRTEIEEYCSFFNLNPRLDSSNFKGIYTRNKIRLELIPYINCHFKTDIAESISRLSTLAGVDGDYLDQQAAEAFEQSSILQGKARVMLDRVKFSGFHPAIAGRVMRIALYKLRGSLKGIESGHIDAAVKLALQARTGAGLDLPGGIRIDRSYNHIRITVRTSGGEEIDDGELADRQDFPGQYFFLKTGHVFNIPVDVPGTMRMKEPPMLFEAVTEKKTADLEKYRRNNPRSFVQYFDFDRLNKGINIRSRKNGDVFKPLGSTGSKKLKEYFIDRKVPRETRDKIPLMALGNEIIWIIGHKISDKFKVTENTKTVLKVQIKFCEDVL